MLVAASGKLAPGRSSSFLFLFLAGMLFAPAARARAEGRYDVSYFSDADLAKVEARKNAVADALGPRLAQRLRVVQADHGYALIYPRHGDGPGARAAAAAHSRILRRLGLGEAACVLSRPWAEVSERGARGKPGPEPARAAEAAETAERQGLERSLDEYVKQLRRQGRLAADERTAWSVYDFTTGEKLVEINADIKLQAASLIKPFVALAFMDQVAAGKLAYDASSRARLERMIQHSDNAATNWAMRRLGGPAAVQALLRGSYGAILRDMELVEYIPPGGRTYRNKASAGDYSRFLLALWRNELPGASEMKRLLALPKRDRLLTGTALPEDTEVFSKTGSTSRLCGDMGVLLAKGPDGRQYAYAVIGIIEKQHAARHYRRWLKSRGNVIREISGMIYRLVGAMHGFCAAR